MDTLEATAQARPAGRIRQARVVALVLGAGVPYLLLISRGWRYEAGWDESGDIALQYLYGSFVYLVLGGGWIWLFLRCVSGDTFTSLSWGRGTLLSDLRDAAVLLFLDVYLSGFYGMLIQYLPGYYDTPATVDYSRHIVSSVTVLLAMIVYNWTAAAVFEEFLRTFFITRLLKFGTSPSMKVLAVWLSTMMIAAYHLYYGPYGAAIVAVTGFLFAGYYIWRGRLLPLILAHGMYGMYSLYWYFVYASPNSGS